MAKRAIAIWWIVGTVVMFAGGSAALFVSFETKQGNFLHGHTGTSVALLVVSISIAAAGVILQLVAWTGALFNTHLLAGRTWFKGLAVGGDRRDRDQPHRRGRVGVVGLDARLPGRRT